MNYTGRYSPPFDITVPLAFYEKADLVLDGAGDAYLHGATVARGKLLPRTQTAHAYLAQHHDFRALLADEGIELVKPQPFRAPQANGPQDFSRRVRS